jgi:hypothetical protein
MLHAVAPGREQSMSTCGLPFEDGDPDDPVAGGRWELHDVN